MFKILYGYAEGKSFYRELLSECDLFTRTFMVLVLIPEKHSL